MTKRRDPSRKFNNGHFPQGTIVETTLHPYFSDEPYSSGAVYVYEVVSLVRNGADSWCINTTTVNPCADDRVYSFSTRHVTRIVSRGQGKVVIENHSVSSSLDSSKYDQRIAERILGHAKHPTKYFTFTPGHLVDGLLERYIDTDMIVDIDKLMGLLGQQGLILQNKGDGCIYVNKKKLQKAVKRLLNKCLVSKKAALAFEDEMFQDIRFHDERDYQDLDAPDLHRQFENVWVAPKDTDSQPETGLETFVTSILEETQLPNKHWPVERETQNPSYPALEPTVESEFENVGLLPPDLKKYDTSEKGVSVEILKEMPEGHSLADLILFPPHSRTLGDIYQECVKENPPKTMLDIFKETAEVPAVSEDGVVVNEEALKHIKFKPYQPHLPSESEMQNPFLKMSDFLPPDLKKYDTPALNAFPEIPRKHVRDDSMFKAARDTNEPDPGYDPNYDRGTDLLDS